MPIMSCVACARVKPSRARGLCSGCYTRFLKTGVVSPPKYRHGLTLEQAFWARVERSIPTACWLWRGHKNHLGYGNLQHEKIFYLAHRLSYELNVGAIPEGLVIDHLCRTPSCVNPAHLEPVTSRENTVVRTSLSPAGANLRKTHCPLGHPYEGDNLRYYKGYRMCATCKRATSRRAYWRSKVSG